MADIRRILAAQLATKDAKKGEEERSVLFQPNERAERLVAVCDDAIRLAEASGRLHELLNAEVSLPERSREIWANERAKLRRRHA